MNKLYSLAFKRILNYLSAESVNSSNVRTLLQAKNIKPIGSFVFERLPRDELKNLLKIPCPVQETKTQQNQAIINNSKSLRAAFSIQEKIVCQKCPHKNSCQKFAVPGQVNNINPVDDLLIYLQAVNEQCTLDKPIQYRPLAAGYKSVDNIIAMLEDLKNDGVEARQFERIRIQHKIQSESKPQPTKTSKASKEQQLGSNAGSQKISKIKNRQQKLIKQRGNTKFQYKDIELQEGEDKEATRKRSNKQQKGKYQKNKWNNQRSFKNQQQQRFPRKRQQRYGGSGQYRKRTSIRNEQQGNNFDSFKPRRDKYNNKFSQQKYGQRKNKYEGGDRNDRYSRNDREQRGPRQNRSMRNERNFRNNDQYKRDQFTDRGNSQRFNNKPQRNRGSRDESDHSERIINNKFESAGNVYKNPKVFQKWDDETTQDELKSIPRQSRLSRQPQINNEFKQKNQTTQNQGSQQQKQQRRGRRIRR